jgi:uncharacterized protein
MTVSYDPAKREKTLGARGLDFEQALEVFSGLHATLRDDRMDYGEERFQTYGYLAGRMVMVVWTPRENSRRIISMRHCHADEEALARTKLGGP